MKLNVEITKSDLKSIIQRLVKTESESYEVAGLPILINGVTYQDFLLGEYGSADIMSVEKFEGQLVIYVYEIRETKVSYDDIRKLIDKLAGVFCAVRALRKKDLIEYEDISISGFFIAPDYDSDFTGWMAHEKLFFYKCSIDHAKGISFLETLNFCDDNKITGDLRNILRDFKRKIA